MAATTTACRSTPALHFLPSSTTDRHRPIYSNPCSKSCKPFPSSKINPTIALSSSKTAAPKRSYKALVISGLLNENSETYPESDSSVSDSLSGCLQHHKLVDNLGLVVEYDLREEIDADRNEDEDEEPVKEITKSRVGDGAGAVSSEDSSIVMAPELELELMASSLVLVLVLVWVLMVPLRVLVQEQALP
ncbi:Mitochondrial import protein TIM [Trema orientale]|uniref:Mitochondrial import protein TIM n=1 Tax=Trema orientale TaxID=63057 RepID=A0A2P5EQY6_TREOI|nr:Mitochondrial import protein TIM [Trema orientale]